MESNDTWRPPPTDLNLKENDVHVWRADLAQSAGIVRIMERTLSEAEQKKAGTFRFAHLKKDFVVTQGFLRVILSLYLDMNPGRITFDKNRYGKPFLSGDSALDTLEFNMSHSRGKALYAVTRGRRIGVDIEYSGDNPDIEAIVTRFFSPGEQVQFFTLPDDQKKEAFYRGWTRKEAFVKAVGRGLYLPLDQFDVSLIPGEPPQLLRIHGDPEEAARWSMASLVPAPGYLGAVAVEGRRLHYCYWQMPEREALFRLFPP